MLNESQRFEQWRDLVCGTYVPIDCVPVEGHPFSARLSARDLGASQVSLVDSCAISYRRSADRIRADGRDEMMVCMVLEGEMRVTQGDRQASATCGDMCLYDVANPYVLEFPDTYRAVTVKLPRVLLSSRLPAPERLTARLVSSHVGLGALAGNMIHEVANLEGLEGDLLARRLASPLADLLALALESQLLHSDAPASRQAQLLQRVKTYMLARLEDPELDIARIADAHQMSPRTLNRLFASEGTTAIHWLWQQRLDASHKALIDGRMRQVTEAALCFGFKDFSHFSRSFKKAFGVLPNTLVRSRR